MSDDVRLAASPFHARTAAANRHNAWITRNGMTLCERYDTVAREALGARLNVALADISWRPRVMFEGARAEQCLSRLMTRNPAELSAGTALKALWLTDGGAVRGAGVIARYGKESFEVIATAPDYDWFAVAADAFAVNLRDTSVDRGGLALIGPHAKTLLVSAGLDAELAPLSFRKLNWRGTEVTLSRWGEHGGYEAWCTADDALLVWDRLMRAGGGAGTICTGIAATDLLDLEAGVARPWLDYAPARDGHAREPMPGALGFDSLIDMSHADFNGRTALLHAVPERRLVGLEIDSEDPAPFTPLTRGEQTVGYTLRSVRSPALERAIALASVEVGAAMTGTVFSLILPPSFKNPELRSATARVVDLPFLPAPISP